MDSITQAALGAAVGEAILGKKLGNRAILWGAFIGTIPDLDVISRLFVDNEFYGLMYHRGITHSILFTLVMPFLFAWLAHKYYEKGFYQKTGWQNIWKSVWLLIYAGILGGAATLLYQFGANPYSLTFMGLSLAGVYPFWNALQKSQEKANNLVYSVLYKEWYWAFFWGILTHWFIDMCTAYGTQIFEPFSNYRVTLNNITIVDPLYTVPLLVGVFGAYFCSSPQRRRLWNTWIGLGLSTGYMAFTFYAKSIVNQVAEQSLTQQNIKTEHYMTTPIILNTILWQAVAEAQDSFYCGMYSLLDKEPKMEFVGVPKNHHLLDPYREHEYVKILLWFAQGSYVIQPDPEGKGIRFCNMRFGVAFTSDNNKEYEFIVFYNIRKVGDEIIVKQEADRFRNRTIGEMLGTMWKRLKGV